MAPAAKDTKPAGSTRAKTAPKSKATPTKPAKETKAATPAKGRKRAADALEETAPPELDGPVKAAKKDVAKKAKAKAKEEDKEKKAAEKETEKEAAPPKAKKAKTTKAAAAAAAVKAEEKTEEKKPAKVTKKKADGDAAKPKKAATKATKEGDAPAAETKPKKATKPKEAAADGAAAPKPKKRKAATIDDAEGKAKTAVATAAKKQKISEETADEAQSLLGIVSSSLKEASKRMSGLFGALTGEEEANGTNETKEKKKPAAKRSSKAKAPPSGEETAVGDHEGALELADSDSDLQDDDPAAAFLQGFESSDEEAASGEEGFGSGRPLPALPKGKNLARKLKGAQADEPGVVYIGRIPHGFHEHEMRAYFSQFGPVDHVRLSRSKKTGRSKHYAFLQFASADVARIAAETMNNYLLFGHILKVHVIPPAQVHPRLWIGADKRFKPVPVNKLQGRKLAAPKGRTEWQTKIDAEAQRRATKATQLQALGYEFAPPVLKNVSAVPARPVAPSATSVTTADHGQIVAVEATEVTPALPPAADGATTPAQAAVDDAVEAAKKPAAAKGSKKPARKAKSLA